MSQPKYLVILEVSRKQEYIFSSKELKDNVCRSAEIAYVTSSAFFQQAAGGLYSEAENLVYAGGGHTVLQFAGEEQARQFARAVTETALRLYDGMEVFVKIEPYAPDKTPGENLTGLSAALEKKKAERTASFRWMSAGIEGKPLSGGTPKPDIARAEDVLQPPAGWIYPARFDEIAGKDNFIAVVHIDGNAMGKRVQNIYQKNQGDWEQCRQSLQAFSAGIQRDFEQTFLDTAYALIAAAPEGVEMPLLPLRPVILAGDDVCFVARGDLGLECARLFLEHLADKTNAQDHTPYAACAGVALVHTKYPFHMAYDLAEQLCSNAKKSGAEIDAEGRISAMDWHIEYGQLKDGLSDIRADYIAEDGCHLELRPVTVNVPSDLQEPAKEHTGGVRTWGYFRTLSSELRAGYRSVPRSKIKELRTAMKQGELETNFAIQNRQISDMLYHVFNAKHRTWAEQRAFWREGQSCGKLLERQQDEKTAFQTIAGVKRCLFFDAIEMIDHCTFLGEEEPEA